MLSGCTLLTRGDVVAGGTPSSAVGDPSTARSTPAPTSSPPTTSGPTTAPVALALAGLLEVKGRAPLTGYERALFGDGWVDVDGNGCDQRNDVLARDLTEVTLVPGTCKVAAGVLDDPFSGRPIDFVRGEDTSDDVQIDHVVALADAWQKGAQAWDAARRERFANDLDNLLAVDGELNQQKGSGDTATWLPPNREFRCAYVARQVGVKWAYGLWVTPAEQAAMVRVLSTCPDVPIPAGLAALGASRSAATPSPTPSSTPRPVSTAAADRTGCDPAYPTVCVPPSPPDLDCRDISDRRFVVLAPDPHRFDGNGDGVGCEMD